MIRLFNVYYPVRTLVLLIGEALIVWTSFLLGVVLNGTSTAGLARSKYYYGEAVSSHA